MIRCGIMWINGAAQGELLPTLTSVIANCARVLATHKSQAWAIIHPPAKATPLTAAIVGLVTSMLSPGTGNMSRGGTVSRSSVISFRSPPAQNALSPEPVRMATRSAGSRSKRSHAAKRPVRMSLPRALRASGRFKVMIAIPSSRASNNTASLIKILSVGCCGPPGPTLRESPDGQFQPGGTRVRRASAPSARPRRIQ